MPLHRDNGADEAARPPLDGPAALREERRSTRSTRVALGSLACPRCDAPVALPGRPAAPADALSCPFCDHPAAVRDFLSLARPLRAPVVAVRVVRR